MAQVRLQDDTVFLSRFDGDWLVVAAACRPTRPVPTTAASRRPDVRALFVAYLVVIWTGLVLMMLVALRHA